MRIIDRYVMRQVLVPFTIGLLVFTFILIIPEIINRAEPLIAKGVSMLIVIQLVGTLLPYAVALALPMSLLLGLLVAFGRLSADREFVAMQACGVSLMRLLRPVAVISILAWAATSYVILIALPSANQTFREILFKVMAARAEGEVRPRVFFDGFDGFVLYVRETPLDASGWNGVFLADNRNGDGATIYVAERGRVAIDRDRRTIEMVLQHGQRHRADDAGKYEVFDFDRLVLSLNPDQMFPKAGPQKGNREMSVAELRERAAMLEASGIYPHNELFEIQKKFSIPFACIVFGLIGLALGASNRRDGKLASFVIGLGVIFVYYVLLWAGQSMVKGRIVAPWVAAWLPNIVLGLAGIALFIWRDRVADAPLRLPFAGRVKAAGTAGMSRLGRLGIPLPLTILDRYVALTYLRIFGLSAVGLSGIFYISTFIDRSEKVLKGDATWGMLAEFMWYATPQYVYYIIPLSVLLATLVTIGLLTKNSELVVMKACGISLYRVALPLVAGAVVAGGVLFALEETVLGMANRRAEALRQTMNTGVPASVDVLTRRWIVGTRGEIYHFNFFDARLARFTNLWVYEFDKPMARMTRRTFVQSADPAAAAADAWQVRDGWARSFEPGSNVGTYAAFAASERRLETPDYFRTERPEPTFMSYTQLRGYTRQLEGSGYDVMEQKVALARKISFPFVTLVMTFIAVPFALTTGRSGAMAGIGVGVAIAIVYWTTQSVFAALGSGGLLTPTLAAWAPNLLFGAGAIYLLLTVRT